MLALWGEYPTRLLEKIQRWNADLGTTSLSAVKVVRGNKKILQCFIRTEWNLDTNGRAFSRCGLDSKSASNHFDPLLHAHESKTFGVLCQKGLLDRKRLPIVTDLHSDSA